MNNYTQQTGARKSARWGTPIAIIAALAMALTGCATEPEAQKSITVVDPWVKTGVVGEMSAGYAEITNNGTEDVTIIAVKSDLSDMIELHETVKDETTGNMVMRNVEDGFTIKSKETMTLEPGGHHFMLMDIK